MFVQAERSENLLIFKRSLVLVLRRVGGLAQLQLR